MGLGEPSTEPVRLLYQRDRESLERQVGGGLNPGDASADDESRRLHRHLPLLERLEMPCPGNAHADERAGFLLGRLRLSRVHPRALIADVDHFQQIGIQADGGTSLPEDGLVGSRGAGGNDDTVQLLLADELDQPILAAAGAGEQIRFGDDHVGQGRRVLRQLLHLEKAGDVDAAVANEDADARRA